MRDTLIAFVMFIVAVGGYIQLKKIGFFEPSVRPVIAAKSSQNAKRDSTLPSTPTKGARHAKKSVHDDDDQQIAYFGQNEGASGDSTETEGLTSIYQESEKPESRPSLAEGSQKNSQKHKQKQASKKKVIHGVPVQAYVNLMKNNISLREVPENSGLGMRVFVQCMELKKRGPEYVGQRDCGALLGAREKRPSLVAGY